MKGEVISGTKKMADLIVSDSRSMMLLTRFGIDLGFGDKTIDQICKEKQIKKDFFLLLLNVFLNPDYFPNKKLKNIDVNLLLTYLANSHRYYMEVKIPLLRELLQSFLPGMHHPVKVTLETFFDGYIQEVTEHIEYEEQVVFPYVSILLAPQPGKVPDKEFQEYGIRIFEKRHTDIEEKLSDLKNLMIKYLPPSETDRFLRIRIICELLDLEQDLVNHARLEDQILIPIVEQLEQRVKR